MIAARQRHLKLNKLGRFILTVPAFEEFEYNIISSSLILIILNKYYLAIAKYPSIG